MARVRKFRLRHEIRYYDPDACERVHQPPFFDEPEVYLATGHLQQCLAKKRDNGIAYSGDAYGTDVAYYQQYQKITFSLKTIPAYAPAFMKLIHGGGD